MASDKNPKDISSDLYVALVIFSDALVANLKNFNREGHLTLYTQELLVLGTVDLPLSSASIKLEAK